MPQLNLPALYFKQHVVKQIGLAGVDPLLDNLFLILPVGIRAFEVPREGFRVHLVFLGLLHEAATLSTYDLLLEGLGYSFLNKSASLVRPQFLQSLLFLGCCWILLLILIDCMTHGSWKSILDRTFKINFP